MKYMKETYRLLNAYQRYREEVKRAVGGGVYSHMLQWFCVLSSKQHTLEYHLN